MTDEQPSDLSGQSDLDMALATLIKNTRTTARHISLPEIASWLDVAIDNLGSVRSVANRLGLSPKMLRQFLAVKEVAPSVRARFANRELDSVDMAVHLKMLPSKEQEVVADEAAHGELNTADVRAIVEFRKQHSDFDIGEIVQRVKASRNIKQYVIEFVVRGSRVGKQELLHRFQDVLGQEHIVSLKVSGSIAEMVVDQRGRTALQEIARQRGCPLIQVVAAIASGEDKE